MLIDLWDISRPKPYEGNPRKLPEKAIKKVAGSIKEFGFRSPIVVDEEGVILAGHTRLEASKLLGLRQVPVHVAIGLTEAQRRAYRLADNRVAQETDWLEDALKLEMDALADLGFDLNLTGFDVPELNRLMHSAEDEERAEETPEPPVNPVSILGDLWHLGNHRLLCGDSTVATDVDKVLGGVKPHLMVTDPPYGVSYDPTWRDGVGAFGDTKMRGKVENDDKADWTEAWSLFPGDVAYVWHGALHASEVANNLDAANFAVRSQIIWVKQHFAMSRGDYHWMHEPCWYAVRRNNKGHWSGDRKQTTVWQISSLNPSGKQSGDTADQKLSHGTQKPIECMRRPICNNSSPGQAVYEPFSGSGTTIMAAELTNRICHAIELNPAYVDVAIERWQNFTGQQAVHESGKTFEEMKDVRYDPDKNSAQSYNVAIAALRERHVAQTEGQEAGTDREQERTGKPRRKAAKTVA